MWKCMYVNTGSRRLLFVVVSPCVSLLAGLSPTMVKETPKLDTIMQLRTKQLKLNWEMLEQGASFNPYQLHQLDYAECLPLYTTDGQINNHA